MTSVAGVLSDLGFRSVAGILEGDKVDAIPALLKKFPDYFFTSIPAKDVRTKRARKATPEVVGLLDTTSRLRPEHVSDVERLFSALEAYLQRRLSLPEI